jgi:hypothetical protein
VRETTGSEADMKRAQQAAAASLALIVIACGGGDDGVADTVGDGLGEEVFEGVGQASGDVVSEESGSVEVGPVTQTADPSTGWVEVDGERHELAAVGSVNFRCEVLDDRITVNFQQTTSGSDLTLQGSVFDGRWNASLTFAPEDASQASYGATIGLDTGTLGIGTNEISYEGPMNRVEDFDLQNATEVEGSLAVNCADPGDGTTADIGGERLTFPFSGASSLNCAVSEDEVGVLIGHNQPEFRQVQIDIRDEGGELFGAAIISAGDNTYSSFVPPDGTGLTIEGERLTYEGVFTTSTDEEVEGVISVSCGL